MKDNTKKELTAWLDMIVAMTKNRMFGDYFSVVLGFDSGKCHISNVRGVAEIMEIPVVTETVRGTSDDVKYLHDEDYFMYKGVRFYECYNYPKD